MFSIFFPLNCPWQLFFVKNNELHDNLGNIFAKIFLNKGPSGFANNYLTGGLKGSKEFTRSNHKKKRIYARE